MWVCGEQGGTAAFWFLARKCRVSKRVAHSICYQRPPAQHGHETTSLPQLQLQSHNRTLPLPHGPPPTEPHGSTCARSSALARLGSRASADVSAACTATGLSGAPPSAPSASSPLPLPLPLLLLPLLLLPLLLLPRVTASTPSTPSAASGAPGSSASSGTAGAGRAATELRTASRAASAAMRQAPSMPLATWGVAWCEAGQQSVGEAPGRFRAHMNT